MSAKWRAIQHRHRYTYNAVVFSSSFIDSLRNSCLSASFSTFYNELQHLISLNSTYSQVNHIRKLASSFNDLLVKEGERNEALVSKAAAFYLEVLFLENSMPLHRTLLSVLAKTKDVFQPVIGECFRLLCNEYGTMSSNKKKSFSVSRVALSVMGMPKLGYLVDVIEDCAVLVCWDSVLGLKSVVSEAEGYGRPPPKVLEQCQEAMSCLYYLFQKFPGKFNNVGGENSNVMEMVCGVLLSLLKSVAFPRDCFVAAGVSFFAAMQVCLSDQELGLIIIQGIFGQIVCSSSTYSDCSFNNVINKVPYKGDVFLDIHSLYGLNRLCLIRGILNAVPRSVLNAHFVVSKEIFNDLESRGNFASSVKTILYEGILPELCTHCENPTDSHFNFHALTVMQICLQQIKSSMLADLTSASENYNPLPEDMIIRLLRIIWNNLEDPLSQTVKQVHLAFDFFLDIQSSLCGAEGSEKIKSFLQKIASDLLCLGPRYKGRYVPLALLTKRFGAKTMLDMCPDLLFEIVQAYTDDDVCCAATSFLKCFLENLRDECRSSYGVERGYAIYRGHCLPPFLHGLASGISKFRSNLNTYSLPVLLEVDVDGIFPLLACISIEPSEVESGLLYPELNCINMVLRVEQRVAVLVSLLKVSRSLALIEGGIDFCDDSVTSDMDRMMENKSFNLYAHMCVKGIKVRIPVEWLVLALTHIDESLRVDAAEFLFLNPKTSSLPSLLELSLMKKAVLLNMRSSSTCFQMKWSSLFRKFFSRVRTALERQVKQGGWQPQINHENIDLCRCKGAEENMVIRAEKLFSFMRWLSCFLFFSCYPSAPYKRKIMAMEVILIMMNVWSVIPSSQENSVSISTEYCLYPYSVGITSPESTFLLVGSIIDSWDRLRESSFRILLHFPTPLPGIPSEDMVQKVITWAKKLVCSPRVRECDAGALTLRFIFRKYVLDLGWRVRASVNVVCSQSQYALLNEDYPKCTSAHPVVEYVKSLIHWLDFAVEEGEKDLAQACKNNFVHGVLLTLRYTFEELDWNYDAILCSISDMRHALEKLLELVVRITSLALWVVSADAWYLDEDINDMVDDDALLLDSLDEMDAPVPSIDQEGKSSNSIRDVRTSDQIVMVGCWLAMKELSLLLGTIIRKVPLPSYSCSGSLESGHLSFDSIDELMTAISEGLLDLKQLEKIGNHFLEVLLKMKHNGAIDKTRAGFTALCNRLLCSNEAMLCKLTESWMEQLMERTVAKGQSVDDLLRRSAGIPAAFVAIFLAEPEGAPKKLLLRALWWLINVANGSLLSSSRTNCTSISCQISSTNLGLNTDSSMIPEMIATEETSKIRDEGVVPTVHAFNVIKAVFNDTYLASDTSCFAAEALIASIRSFTSPYWEVRNSACLAYTSLVRRMIGFLNVHKRESSRHALTGLEFFHRYHTLHRFFSNELEIATELLGDSLSGQSTMAKVVHPSLCPMLILLSRLKPSTIASETGDDLDPFLFMPFIRKCSTQSNLRVRDLASRALTGLVSNEKLPTVLLNIASELPHAQNQTIAVPAARRASYNSIHGLLLQLCSLVDINCRNLADFSRKDRIVGDLVKVLLRCSWVASPKRCPCPILNCTFLQLLDHMLSVARSCHMSKNLFAIRNLLSDLSTECMEEASYGLPHYDPTVAELRQQATASYFSCLFQASDVVGEEVLPIPQRSPLNSIVSQTHEVENTESLERLIRSLSDSSYEVRLVTLKWLLKFLKTRSCSKICYLSSIEIRTITYWTKANLQVTLMKMLELEKNHRCIYYILRTIFTWNLLKFQELGEESDDTLYVGELDSDSIFELWDRLISLYKLSRHSKTRETLVCCLAICVKQFARLLKSFILTDKGKKGSGCNESDQLTDGSAHFYECVTFFVNLIKQHSSSSEPITMRRAAAESMLASGLLEQAEVIASSVINQQIPSEKSSPSSEQHDAVNIYAHQVLEMWFACVKLLEDEDDGIRQMLAPEIQKRITLKSSGTYVASSTQVERVIELSLDHLSSIFGHWILYFDYLLQRVLDAANHVIPQGDPVRRVFDKEIDNHHEEKLLIGQICCANLMKLPITKSWPDKLFDKEEVANYLLDWRKRFSQQLISFAKDHIGKIGIDWIGGVGNHKDAFLPLYTNLLGFYALSNCIFDLETNDDGKHLLSDVVELGKAIDPFLTNFLISNLYVLIVRLHEKKYGAMPNCINTRADIWHDFDPYFLIR